eukprot:10648958-Lingulodinium_polyedra.AAC.1
MVCCNCFVNSAIAARVSQPGVAMPSGHWAKRQNRNTARPRVPDELPSEPARHFACRLRSAL